MFRVGGVDGEWFAVAGAEGALLGTDDVEFMVGEFGCGTLQQVGVAHAYRGLHEQVLAVGAEKVCTVSCSSSLMVE